MVHLGAGIIAGRAWLSIYEDPDTPEATEYIQDQMRRNHEIFAGMGRRMYGDYWRSVEEPRHQRWIQRLAELDVLETPAVE